MKRPKRKYLPTFVAAALAALPAALAAQSDDLTERLAACAKIEATDARVACYDVIGEEALAEGTKTAAATAVPAETPAAASATSAPTNVPYRGSSKPPEEYRIAVTECQRNNVDDTYLILDNGEVWKQTSGKRIRDSDCAFTATLRKDFFGYKIFIDNDDGAFRVKRVK